MTGHTPTLKIKEGKDICIYEENGHIAIDCGCVYGHKLAAYCLDDGSVRYVEQSKVIY